MILIWLIIIYHVVITVKKQVLVYCSAKVENQMANTNGSEQLFHFQVFDVIKREHD